MVQNDGAAVIPSPAELSPLEEAPSPFDRQTDHVAEDEEHTGPQERACPIGDLEDQRRHLHRAGDDRHRGAEWPGEPAEHDRPCAPFLEETWPLGSRSG